MFFYLSKEWFAKIYSLKTKCYLNYRNTVRHVLCNQSINQSINSNLEDIKASLISDLKTRVEDRILEPENLKLLSKLINQAETIQEAIEIAKLGTSYKRTGFHFDQKIEKLGGTIKYFKKNEKLSFTQKEAKNTHKLIIGDNFDALQNLLISYKNKIDVIYIDPPYGKDDMGEFAVTNYNNAITRDNLLSMLYPRLVLARQLLSEEGVIFCSIDDKNQAYVKCLFDEIFGENNFVASAPRKTGAGAAAKRGDAELRKPYDYVLIYTAERSEAKFTKKKNGVKEYPFNDEDGKYRLEPFQASGSDATRKARPNLYYPIYVNNDNSLSLENGINTKIVILPEKVKNQDGRWMWRREKFEDSSNKFLQFYNGKIYRKVYFDENEDQSKYQVEKAFFDESDFRNSEGTKLLKDILGKDVFNNPKPVNLIKHLIKLQYSNSFVVLDFFAGSGTTGQAVLELNKVDGGKRKFIVCTNNEITENNPNGIAYDVTSKRLKRVMTGSCYDGTNDFEWIKKNKPLGDNLDVYEIAEVSNSEQRSGKTPFEVIDETLYGQPRLLPEEKIEWVCKNFEHTQKYLEDTKTK